MNTLYPHRKNKEYYKDNTDKILEKNKKYYEKNKIDILTHNKTYRELNKNKNQMIKTIL